MKTETQIKKPSFYPARTVADYVCTITCMLLMGVMGAFIALAIR